MARAPEFIGWCMSIVVPCIGNVIEFSKSRQVFAMTCQRTGAPPARATSSTRHIARSVNRFTDGLTAGHPRWFPRVSSVAYVSRDRRMSHTDRRTARAAWWRDYMRESCGRTVGTTRRLAAETVTRGFFAAYSRGRNVGRCPTAQCKSSLVGVRNRK